MKLIFTLTITFLLFSCQGLLAQNTFVQGYIVTQEKDTLRGYLEDNLDWDLT